MRRRSLRLGIHVEVAAIAAGLLLIGVALGDWHRFFALTPSPLLVPVLWGALRGGLVPALVAAVLGGSLHALGAVAANRDVAVLPDGELSWALFALAAVAYVVGQARDLLATRVARLRAARADLQAEASRQRGDIEVLEHANRELKQRIFDRSFDFESLVATVARSSLTQDAHMFEAPLDMLVNFCGATRCSVLLVLPDGTLDLAAHRGWHDSEIGPRLEIANHNNRVLRAIVEARPVVELGDDADTAGPLLIAPIADGTGLIKALVCIDEMPPARFEETSVKTFLGIVSWLATNLRRIQMREATSENKQQMMLALNKTKDIGTVAELSERIFLEDARRKRYGVETEIIAIRLLDMRINMDDYVESLETRLIHVLNTTTRVTDDVFEFGFSGCYVLLLTACKPGNGETLLARLEERFAVCQGKDFGPVELSHFATTAEAPDLSALLQPLTEYFCSTSPMPLAPECPVPAPRPQRSGDAEAFARRLRLETDIARRLGTDLNMIDFRREGPGIGVGPMIARHLWNSVGTLLRVTDGIYVVSPSRCVVLLPFTSCVDASTIWFRLDETLRASLPQQHYDDVRAEFLALDVKNLRDTVRYFVGSLPDDGREGSPATMLSENELTELSFLDGELAGRATVSEELEQGFRVLASNAWEETALSSPEAIADYWQDVFGDTKAEPAAGAANASAADADGECGRVAAAGEAGARADAPDDVPIAVDVEDPPPSLADTELSTDGPTAPTVAVSGQENPESIPPEAPDDVRPTPTKRRWEVVFDGADEVDGLGGDAGLPTESWRSDAAGRRDAEKSVIDPTAPVAERPEAGARRWEVVFADCEEQVMTTTERKGPEEFRTAVEDRAGDSGLAPMPDDSPMPAMLSPADWRSGVEALVDELASRGEPFTSADIRNLANERGIGEPERASAWGLVMAGAANRGLIAKTGRNVESEVIVRQRVSSPEWVGCSHEDETDDAGADPSTVRLLLNQIEGLLAVCMRLAGRTERETKRD